MTGGPVEEKKKKMETWGVARGKGGGRSRSSE
jgi:hypothetical protein